MNEEFEKLTLQEQVDFINKELAKDSKTSVTKLFKKFGINKSTILTRFRKEGYKYNNTLREYTKEIIQDNNKNIIKKDEISKENIELKNTLSEVKELLEMKEQLKEIIEDYNKNKNIIRNDPNESKELRIDKSMFKGNFKNRLVKVYDNVNKSWIKFCKENNQYKMQDLYSLALLEFIEKYKK
jgi:hypothetical protein